jgi:predicted MFS family arabinose efflux permease
MRIPAIVYVLALGTFALITTELGVIGILPQVSEASHQLIYQPPLTLMVWPVM